MKIVSLASNNYTAKVNLSRGGNCISLKNSKYDADILCEPDYSHFDNPFIYGMPILFPANRISDAEFLFEGRKYKFPVNEKETGCHLHGFIHEAEFMQEELCESRVVCTYNSKQNNVYPNFIHEFEIKLNYELSSSGLTHKTTIINNSDKNMPYFLGFHTSFNILFLKKTNPEDVYVCAEVSKEFERGDKYLPTGKILEFDEVSKELSSGNFKPYKTPISRHYCIKNDGKMVIYDQNNNLSVVYENDKKFRYRLIFNEGSKGFICLEPQTCLVNSPNSPFAREESGFDYIKPFCSKNFISRIYISEGDMR